MSKKLTPKQRKFCEEYVTTGNGSEAYRRAYDVRPNTTIDSIKVRASELLKNSNIKVTIQELQDKQAKKFEITRSDVAKGYLEIIQAWRSLMQLASKEELTKDEKQKFYLLKEMVKAHISSSQDWSFSAIFSDFLMALIVLARVICLFVLDF